MTGPVPAGDEGRWAEAEELLDDVDRTGPPRGPGRRWPAAASIAISLAVLVLTAVVGAIVRAGGRSVPAWREGSGIALSVAGFVLAAIAGVWMWRSGQRGGRPPLTVLTREQRRWLQEQIRGRLPVDPARLRLTRYRAIQLSQQAPGLLLFAGLCVLVDGQTLVAGERLLVVLSAVLAIAFVAGTVVVPRQIDQGRAFLDRHPEPSESATYIPPGWSAAVVDGPDGPAGIA